MAQECCDTEEKDLQRKNIVDQAKKTKGNDHSDKDEHEEGDEHDHGEEDTAGWKTHLPLLSSLAILLVMLVLEFGFKYQLAFPVDLIIFAVAYFLAGYNVLYLAFRKAKRFDFFNEFFLMSVATIGAFSIGS